MIFLSLIVLGVLTGLAMTWRRLVSLGSIDAAYGGATGAFLAGGTVAGIAARQVGAFDPIALAVGLAGAIVAVLVVARVAGTWRARRQAPKLK